MSYYVHSIHLCYMHGIHQLPLVKHQLYIYTVCVYQTLRAVCFQSLLYVFFYTKHVHVCMYVSKFVPVCLQHLCTCVPVVCA